MEIKISSLPDQKAFRFFADFDVTVSPAAARELSTFQRNLLQSIAASPAVTRRIAQMAIETDLADLSGRHISGLFEGPNNDAILDCVLACLSKEDREHWSALRDQAGDTLHEAIVPVFLAFEVTLHRAGLHELSPAARPLSKDIGPLIEATKDHTE